MWVVHGAVGYNSEKTLIMPQRKQSSIKTDMRVCRGQEVRWPSGCVEKYPETLHLLPSTENDPVKAEMRLY